VDIKAANVYQGSHERSRCDRRIKATSMQQEREHRTRDSFRQLQANQAAGNGECKIFEMCAVCMADALPTEDSLGSENRERGAKNEISRQLSSKDSKPVSKEHLVQCHRRYNESCCL
jgi:hypothetical protein